MATQVSSHIPHSANSPEAAYQALVAQHLITPDAEQLVVLAKLQQLHQALSHEPARPGLLKRLLGAELPLLKGVYIYGDVGRGKSMLMDIFYTTLPLEKKRRVHFHRFMQDVHAEFRLTRSKGEGDDPIATLVAQLSKDVEVLCFDELQATDVADATLITRLFEGLLEHGVTIVATSNRIPEKLYTGEVQKERFERLTSLINEHFDVLHLTSAHDYRRQQIRDLKQLYMAPLNAKAEQFISDTLHHLAPAASPSTLELQVQGRGVSMTIYGEKIGLASFAELCETPLGAADYLAIAAALDVLVLTDIPILKPEKRNEAKRFVTLIDALYEHKVKLIATAAAQPEALYPEGHGRFEFERTVSRLIEMQSKAYMEALKQ